MTISSVHSGTMGQEISGICTAYPILQPIPPKSDRLLGEVQSKVGLIFVASSVGTAY